MVGGSFGRDCRLGPAATRDEEHRSVRSPGGARGPPQGSGSDDGSAHPPPVVSPAGPPAWGLHSAQAHGLGRHPLPRGLSDGCTKTRRSSRAGSRDSSAAQRCHRAQGEGWGGQHLYRRLCARLLEQACQPGVGQTQYLHGEEGL